MFCPFFYYVFLVVAYIGVYVGIVLILSLVCGCFVCFTGRASASEWGAVREPSWRLTASPSYRGSTASKWALCSVKEAALAVGGDSRAQIHLNPPPR